MSESESVGVDVPVAATDRRRKEQQAQRPKRQPRYNVVLWNDDDHTYAYVIVMLMQIFGHPPEKGYQLAQEVDTRGRAILLTTTREHAELKQEQVHSFGKDALIENCAGSMTATVEPVEEG